MARPKFYLDTKPAKDGKFPVILSYSFNKSRLKYYPNVHINKADYVAEYWKGNKKPIKTTAPFAPQYNNLLRNIEADAVKLVTMSKGEELSPAYIKEQLDLIYKPKPVASELEYELLPADTSFVKYFEDVIADSKSGRRVIHIGNKQGARYSTGAIKSYAVTLAAIKRYMLHKKLKDIEFADIDLAFYNSFRDFVFNVENKEKSTFGGYVKHIKILMAESKNPIDSRSFVKPNNESDTIYLTNIEIDKIAALDLSNRNLNFINERNEKIGFEALEKARDLFLIGAYTGLRFSDFGALEIKSIEGNFIKLKQAKTGDRVTIPIMSKLKPVLAKYPDALPSITNQKFNYYIKYIAELAGLDDIRELKNTKGNKTNAVQAPLYSLISSHCCRRSYATNMFKAGVPPMLIMSATGHKTESSFLKYIRANNDDKAKLLAETLEKLGL